MNARRVNRHLQMKCLLILGTALLVCGLPYRAEGAEFSLEEIQHIVVIYQDGWSFDALYGDFPGADGLAQASVASLTQKVSLEGTQDLINSPYLAHSLKLPPCPIRDGDERDAHFLADQADANSAARINTLRPYYLTDPALLWKPSIISDH